MYSDVLTIADVLALAEVVNAASQSAKVAYMGVGGDVVYGTARHIVGNPDTAGFLRHDQDIRAGYLRVTLKSGFEAFPTVGYLAEAYTRGEFQIYDW